MVMRNGKRYVHLMDLVLGVSNLHGSITEDAVWCMFPQGSRDRIAKGMIVEGQRSFLELPTAARLVTELPSCNCHEEAILALKAAFYEGSDPFEGETWGQRMRKGVLEMTRLALALEVMLATESLLKSKAEKGADGDPEGRKLMLQLRRAAVRPFQDE